MAADGRVWGQGGGVVMGEAGVSVRTLGVSMTETLSKRLGKEGDFQGEGGKWRADSSSEEMQ